MKLQIVLSDIFRVIIVYISLTVCGDLLAADVDFSADYERIFQIRVVSPDAGGKSSIGSGFQVSADGLIVTNYHVVSEYVNSPETYEIRYATHDDKHGLLQLLDFDVVNDIALLRHPKPGNEFFSFASRSVTKGEMAYALGNPGDWGIVMVPGPNNGLVEHLYEDRVLFSGSLNPGMSGGPSLSEDGYVIGVNVATAGSQLSFLVPANKAVALINTNRKLDAGDYQTEISRQIKSWQRPRIQALIDEPWALEHFADRQLFGEIRRDFQCWGDTNDSDSERKVARVSRFCNAGDNLYIGHDLNVGQIGFSFKQRIPLKLNKFQFARTQNTWMSARNRSAYKHATNYQCETDFIDSQSRSSKKYFRVVTCVRAYRQLEGLYDSLVLVQEQENKQAFVANLSLSALEKDQIQALNKRFIERIL